MQFAHPYYLNWLWILLIVFGIMAYGILKKKKILAGFAELKILPVITPDFNVKRLWISAILTTIAMGFTVVALSGPLMGFKWEKIHHKGVDIMIALDCSQSMMARDIKPSRLERAKREVIDLLNMMRADRAGLVAFSGSAVLQCPLTLDHTTFNIFLDVLNPQFLPVGGTDLGEALRVCANGFDHEADTKKAVILITDGENTVGDDETAARELAKMGIKVFCIGVGDSQGAPIPDETGGFIKDGQGNIVLSKVDADALKKISDITGGTYVRSVAGDMDLDVIYQDKILSTMERKTISSGKKKVWEDRFQWFLLPAVILLLVELGWSGRKSKSKRNHLQKSVTPLGVLIFFIMAVMAGPLLPLQADAQSVYSSVKKGVEAYEQQAFEKAEKHFIDAQLEQPDNPEHYYNIGAAAYMNKDYEQAKNSFVRALETDDRDLRHQASYNLANTHYRLGNLEDAIQTYEEILKEFPEDTQSKENLAFVKKKKEAQQKQPPSSDQDQDNKKDKKNHKDQEKDKESQNQDQQQNPENQQDKQESSTDQNRDRQEKEENQDSQKDSGGNDDPEDQDASQGNRPENENQEQQEGEGASAEEQPDEDPSEKGSLQAGAQKSESGEKKPDARLEKLLNRLEDKPGKAMMPVKEKQFIEKEW